MYDGIKRDRVNVKRRGILAAAVGVVTGIAAKQMSAPVAASQSFLLPNTETNGLFYSVMGPTTIAATNGFSSTSAMLVLDATHGNTEAGVHGTIGTPVIPPFGCGVFGQGGASVGVYGTSNVTAVRGDVPAVAVDAAVAVHGNNESTGAGVIGVQGTSPNGLGASFQGGIAPVRLVPGALPARSLTNAGHQAGEMYMTSDNRLFLFDGTNWREVLLAAPGQGVPPAAAARPSTAGTATQPVQPIPKPRP